MPCADCPGLQTLILTLSVDVYFTTQNHLI
ncbi:MAG: copper resistance protein NlpE [Actinobacteria bacterium]|nr:copper resistance protein NlpE [Actinomycetota bacterium]